MTTSSYYKSSVSLCQTNSSSRSQDLNLGFPTTYGKPGAAGIFVDFRKVMRFTISNPNDPTQDISELLTTLQHLSASKVEIPENLKATSFRGPTYGESSHCSDCSHWLAPSACQGRSPQTPANPTT